MQVIGRFVLHQFGSNYLAVPSGAAAVKFNGILNFNETGALMFQRLLTGATKQELVAAICAEYEVSAQEAAQDAENLLSQLRELDLLIEDSKS